MLTQTERLAALEQRLGDHEARCEERLTEIKATAATTLRAVEGLKSRSWGVVAALLAWALAQVWSANLERIGRLEAARPSPEAPEIKTIDRRQHRSGEPGAVTGLSWNGATTGIRTLDLSLTKDALYH